MDSGDSAGWLSDPLRPSTSSIRAASLSLLAYSRQPIKVVTLIQELQTLLRKGAVEPAPQSPGLYNSLFFIHPLNIQPVVVVRGLKRQQVAALTNFVGCFLSLSLSFFSSSALNDLAGPSAGPLARKTYSIPFFFIQKASGRGTPSLTSHPERLCHLVSFYMETP